ncbi:MAG: SH3 domain-containing protein, partial [Bradymonadia bacterium]
LNVRAGAGTGYKVLGTLSRGQKVSVKGETNGWLNINYNGKNAYVSKKYTSVSTGGASASPAQQAPAKAPSSGGGKTATVTCNALNVRAGAGTGYAIIGKLSNGQRVSVKSDAGGWLNIDYNGKNGYISKQYTSLAGGSAGGSGGQITSTGKRQLLRTRDVAAIESSRKQKQVRDLKTGKTFNVSWAASPGYHTDWTPMTASDTTVIKSLLSSRAPNHADWAKTSSWSWDGRPGEIQLSNGAKVAVGFHLRPHAAIMGGRPGYPLANKSNTRPSSGWALGGHMCMYYGDSPGGTQSCNTAAKNAVNM